MSWAQSLIKLSTYEVETLQKRLAEISDRRMHEVMRLAMLHAEGEAEMAQARLDPSSGYQVVAYLEALKARKEAVQSEIHMLEVEEAGARDALAQAFEAQKKYEHIAEQIRLTEKKEADRIEAAEMDEMGLRRSGRR
ncbi:MAG: flagellar export protein FliJ [Phenylobacterium sp.]